MKSPKTIILKGQFRKVSLFVVYEFFRLCMDVQFMSRSMVNAHHEVIILNPTDNVKLKVNKKIG